MRHLRGVLGACVVGWAISLMWQAPGQAQTGMREKIGQMFMVGFPGTTVPGMLAADIRELHLGGVLLFAWNVSDRAQLRELTSALQALSPTALLIGIDEEGGYVARLDEQNGYARTPSAYHLGRVVQNEDSTRAMAATMAGWLAEGGINLNLAPVVDVNVNPESPAIGHWERSFSDDPRVVAGQAQWFIEEHHRQNIITTLKHFPGHGSASQDSHLGFTDITQSWSDLELEPYRVLIGGGLADLVMVGHLFHAAMDSIYPASLSKNIITGLLRQQLGFQGVVVSDEMFMKAITDSWGFGEALELAINAGTDILLYSTNTVRGRSLAQIGVDLVEQKIAEGRITAARIDASYQRIQDLKRRWLTPTAVAAQNARRSGGLAVPSVAAIYPNPFNAATRIVIDLPAAAFVRAAIFDVRGRTVARLVAAVLPAGRHTFDFDGTGLPSGLYFARLVVPGFSQTQKMTLLR